MILSPSLLSADTGRLAAELADLEAAGIAWAHWDVMDGRFVPNITFGQHVIRSLRPASRLFFDVHLMIVEPERYLEAFHAELRRLGMRAGVALNPATPLCVLDHVLDDADMVLLMSVNPGFGGQSFLPSTYAKLARLREMLGRRETLIQIDGGVTPENTGELVRAGADVLVSGSSFFGNPPYEARRLAFERAAD